MKYISTRGDSTPRAFCDILLEGLAPDGGLYLPAHYPQVDRATLARWRAVYGGGRPGGYADLAFEILSLYIDDIPSADEIGARLEAFLEANDAQDFGRGEL